VAWTVGSTNSSAPELSYLYQPAFCMDYELRPPAEQYIPQPGDIFLATGREWWAKLGHWLAGTGAPQHSGIIVADSDGRLVLLEAGPHNTLHCGTEDIVFQLTSYAALERVWIRRRRVPLTCEQSARLTAFAQSVEGKRFAFWRMLRQVTPFRCRGPQLALGLGCPHGDRSSYFCAELVAEACVAAGLLNPLTTRPSAMYPRDFFFGCSNCPFIHKHLDMSEWYPPARWTLCPGREPLLGPPRPYLDGDER
jgi:hypothetical protein